MKDEYWKPIKGYEGFYEVSNKGNVRSVERFDRLGRRRKSELISVNGVQQLGLYHDGKRKNLSVKNLVADAFLEAPQADEKLIHVDGNPKNNCAENLMWQKKAQKKRNVYRFEDNKNGEIFEGSIGECCDAWGLTKTALLNRASKGRVTKTLIGVKGLRTFTNIETGEKFHGTKQQAREYFHISWSTLDDKIASGLIQMFPPDDEPMDSEDKISDPKTKRILNRHFVKEINKLGLRGEE
ncbi:NUMOD4 domain-containing protein [Streptococcus sp.]|uniref:NUMOD4 domain-containing protein n=1 Tax=Streptococcus sp. TaxID=1306 RepID=UPI000ED73529|nr:NUMOD4 domain-containing protein [Streptococcus sp.]MCO4566686.1 hypothetical protein [Streptococcus infantarius subsp. infantarius]HCT82476.1 hypothetical protein [Streptococcus sp.]